MWSIDYNYIQSTLAPDDVLLIRYEDLLDYNLRIVELNKIIKFLDFPLVTLEQSICAFQLADKEGAHRHAQREKGEILTTELFDKVIIVLFYKPNINNLRTITLVSSGTNMPCLGKSWRVYIEIWLHAARQC